MKLTVWIDGLEAVPVRAIPFVVGFEPFTRKRYLPPSLIWESARQAADIWPDDIGIPALRLFLQGKDGTPEPAEFDHLGYLASDDDLLPENDEPVHDAALRLPAGLFAYVDQLQRFVDWMYPAGHSGDGQCRDAIQLKLSMQMDVGLSHAIFEGFEHIAANRTQGNDRVADDLVDWYNEILSANWWFSLDSTKPREAAMLLCQFNPHDEKSDPLEVFNPETGPKEYRQLLRTFEDVAADGKLRSLLAWIDIAKKRQLKYHSWIDHYVARSVKTACKKLIGKDGAGHEVPVTAKNDQPIGDWKNQRIGWKKSVVAVWPSLLEQYRRKPTIEEIVAKFERDDPEGYIVPSCVPDELKWRRSKGGDPKPVCRDTIEDFIGGLPGYRAQDRA